MGTHFRAGLHAAAAALVISALSVGCVDDDPVLDSSNRGAGSHTETTSVENAFIVPRFVPGACAIQVGSAAVLNFTVTNNRDTETDRLLAVESPSADNIRISPRATVDIPAGTTIAAGEPVEAVGEPEGIDQPFFVTVEGLDESVRPGTSVDVTFRFEKQGDLVMNVPIEACPAQQ